MPSTRIVNRSHLVVAQLEGVHVAAGRQLVVLGLGGVGLVAGVLCESRDIKNCLMQKLNSNENDMRVRRPRLRNNSNRLYQYIQAKQLTAASAPPTASSRYSSCRPLRYIPHSRPASLSVTR